MTPEEIIASALSALGPVEMVGTLATGFLSGIVIPWPIRRDSHTFDVIWGIALVGVIFFTARGLALFFEASTLWPRNAGFAVMWIGFCVALGIGLYVRRRGGLG